MLNVTCVQWEKKLGGEEKNNGDQEPSSCPFVQVVGETVDDGGAMLFVTVTRGVAVTALGGEKPK